MQLKLVKLFCFLQRSSTTKMNVDEIDQNGCISNINKVIRMFINITLRTYTLWTLLFVSNSGNQGQAVIIQLRWNHTLTHMCSALGLTAHYACSNWREEIWSVITACRRTTITDTLLALEPSAHTCRCLEASDQERWPTRRRRSAAGWKPISLWSCLFWNRSTWFSLHEFEDGFIAHTQLTCRWMTVRKEVRGIVHPEIKAFDIHDFSEILFIFTTF